MTYPRHLQHWIASQEMGQYSDADHKTWRAYWTMADEKIAPLAHPTYFEGVSGTGMTRDAIPSVAQMSEAMGRFGWSAVPVSGFIAPGAFMEFLSHRTLPIACEIRQSQNLDYTPAPDIIHEAAGHAPFLVNPDYAAFMQRFGEVVLRMGFTDEDMRIYEAVRQLSDIKEKRDATPQQIREAQQQLDYLMQSASESSTGTGLTRLFWWTIEYGLIGPMDSPQIYGAGLLSSVGEGAVCLGPQVKKYPLSLDCTRVTFDITQPQPQLFVVPSFRDLREILEAYSFSAAA